MINMLKVSMKERDGDQPHRQTNGGLDTETDAHDLIDDN